MPCSHPNMKTFTLQKAILMLILPAVRTHYETPTAHTRRPRGIWARLQMPRAPIRPADMHGTLLDTRTWRPRTTSHRHIRERGGQQNTQPSRRGRVHTSPIAVPRLLGRSNLERMSLCCPLPLLAACAAHARVLHPFVRRVQQALMERLPACLNRRLQLMSLNCVTSNSKPNQTKANKRPRVLLPAYINC